MDQVKTPIFNAWIIPGVIVPPFENLKPPEETWRLVGEKIAGRFGHSLTWIGLIKAKEPPLKKRSADKIYCRQQFYYFMKDVYKREASLMWLGELFGQDHTTVLHGIKEYSNRIFTDGDLPHLLTGGTVKKVRQDYYEFNQLIRSWL
jgi:hypothetical protein